MALIGNYSILNRQLSRAVGGTTVANTPNQICPTGFYKNRFGSFDNNAATPNGYLAPAAWVLPMKSGGMSSYNQVQLSIVKSAAILVNAQYISGTSSITVSNTNANLGQIFAAVASGTISVAQGVVDLSALFAASGSSIISFTLTNATLGGTFSMGGSSTITVTPSGLLTAIAFMEAEAGGATPLSPEGLAAAVWNAAAASFNDVGSMGEKLNDAGSASNPWTEVIESGYTAAEVLRILMAVASGRTDITDLGGGSATVKFKSIDGTKDRIEATMTGSERTTVSIDETE
jgi:hypothetical protein